ncbi:MAG: hypothetical protein A3F78_11745 [Burkholderiales bacterium RIFCSPLOWO2_12_FULL_61_40]|nr:MAG: hypothetical protein A3F78_11745 [Burkholderiales bacterium RIFCSPLOWO2_12_FULL_61_40]
MVHWESLLERDAIYHFEYHPLVISYQEQPSIEIYYDALGKQHRYFPDFRLNLMDGSEIYIEVKPARFLATKKVQEKLQAVATRFEEQARQFRVMTEVEIRRQPLFANLIQIHKSSKRAAQIEPDTQMIKTLSGGPRWTLSDLCKKLLGIGQVLRLVRSKHLRVNLEASLSDDTEVWLADAHGGCNGSFYI